MKYRFSSIASLAFVAVPMLAIVMSACTTNTVVAGSGDAGPPPCDPTVCNPGNTCIPDATGVAACRLACTKHSDCPFNYQCLVSGTQDYCVALTYPVPKKPTGQWGTPCLPQDGITGNPACDADTMFSCYAAGTTDALAYCTQYDCMKDIDCAGGYYCATINNAPNAKSDVRSFGKTRTVCLKREYCAPCAGDLDCPVIDGKQARCVADSNGGQFCATQCDVTTNCRLDATCATGLVPDGTKVCRPRAHTCKGDGTICSPCRSDADCPNGFCVKGGYSPETFCSVKSAIPCVSNTTTMTTTKQCPAFTLAGTTIGCIASADQTGKKETADPAVPADQCIGVVDLGDTGDVGCYTRH